MPFTHRQRSCVLHVADEPEPAGRDEPVPITLSFVPTGSPRSVSIAGTFNGWNRSATPLAPQQGSLAWTVTLRLPPGEYMYRYVVNGTRWLTPSDAPHRPDGSGTVNAVLRVAPEDFARRAARAGDGTISASGVCHRVETMALPTAAGVVRYVVRVDQSRVRITLRTRREDVQAVRLVTPGANENPAAHVSTPLRRQANDSLFDYWSAAVTLPAGGRALSYAFVLRDGGAERTYDSAEALQGTTRPIHWFHLDPADFPPLVPPDWARDAIFYQIFPDRFANGDSKNDPPNVQPWGSAPTGSNRMGGDLAGVLDRIEYLRDLGVNALYLNPIFTSRSNHGYDTTDYKQIDPRFGTIAELKSLTARAHLHGWHVILDGVFNHTGVDFFAFKNLEEEGPRSPYRRWYYVHGFPVRPTGGRLNYEGWNGLPWLPKLNVANPETRDYLLDVATYWIQETGIDGWRLDAANEVPHPFWKQFRKRVKTVKPDALLLGEIWPDASEWLQGDEMDSVMNYRWRGAALDFFAFDRSLPTQFDGALDRIRADYPPAAAGVMFNMLGSHDVERLRTLCRGDWTKERQAIAFQMCYPGAPCIYYGDEVGLEGGKDPDDRRAMPRDPKQWDQTTLAFFKSAIALRRAHPALRRGDFRTLVADNKTGLYAFLRTYNGERAVVVFNRSDTARSINLPAAKIGPGLWKVWLAAGATALPGGGLTLKLEKRGFAVLGR